MVRNLLILTLAILIGQAVQAQRIVPVTPVTIRQKIDCDDYINANQKSMKTDTLVLTRIVQTENFKGKSYYARRENGQLVELTIDGVPIENRSFSSYEVIVDSIDNALTLKRQESLQNLMVQVEKNRAEVLKSIKKN